MTKLKILALLIGVVLLLSIPATASAQRLPPHVFVGSMIDGAAAVDGTVVTAWVDDAEVDNATVTDGEFVLTVDQGDASYAGKTVSFQIDGVAANETMPWMQGGGDEVSLTSSATPEPEEAVEAAPEPMATGVPGARGSRGPSGPRGPAGDAGPAGDKGDTGSAGSTGSAGAKGDTGSAGAKGAAGSAGATGPAGPAGATGSAGAEGDDGSSVLGIIALILAIVAIVGAGGAYMLGRRT